MSLFGHLVVCIATLLSAAGGVLALNSAYRPGLLSIARRLLLAAGVASAVSLLVLVFLLVTYDFRVAYVHDYADRTMSLGYLVMALWGGQEGSLLLWAALQSWFTSAVALWWSKDERHLLPVALGFLSTLQLFFFCLVLFHSNPFESLGTVAAHGVGMNPLLRNPYMAVHPPTLFLGFVGFSVPMAFALAALTEGCTSDEWFKKQRSWLLFAWVFLTVGNILGMVWAYEELGWGGYWGWDPVENASFMPWLTGTALVHSSMALERRGMFRISNFIFIALTFTLIIFGTFLTRSAVIESVHAFTGATAGPYLLGLIVFCIVVFISLAVWRWRYLTESRKLESLVSKEGIFWAANLAFVLSAVFVWLATMAPLFAELFKGEKVAVTPGFFNTWMVPLGLVILALVALCSIIGWRKQSAAKIGPRALFPISGGVIAVLIVGLSGGARPDLSGFLAWAPIISIGLIGFVGGSVLQEIVRIVRAHQRGGSAALRRRRLGGQVVHLAVILLFVGFTGSAFTKEQSGALSPGKTMKLGDYSLRLLGVREDHNFERRAVIADLDVRKFSESIGVLSPARYTYHSHPGQPTSEVVIRTSLSEDLFLILGNSDPARGWVSIRAVVNPLVIWIWIGGALLVIGTLIALIPQGWTGRVFAAEGLSKRRAVEVMAFLAFLVAVLISIGSLAGLAEALVALIGAGLIGMLLLFGGALGELAAKRGER